MENTGDNIKYTVESYDGYYWTEESSFNDLAKAIKELKHMKKSLPSWTFRLIESQWKVIEDNMKTPEELMVTITKEKYESLKADSRWARCLAMAGVDNWDGIVHARGLFIDLQENDL